MPLQSVRNPVNMHIDSDSNVTKAPFRSELQSCQKYGIRLRLPSSLQSQERHLWAYYTVPGRERSSSIVHANSCPSPFRFGGGGPLSRGDGKCEWCLTPFLVFHFALATFCTNIFLVLRLQAAVFYSLVTWYILLTQEVFPTQEISAQSDGVRHPASLPPHHRIRPFGLRKHRLHRMSVLFARYPVAS